MNLTSKTISKYYENLIFIYKVAINEHPKKMQVYNPF